MDRQEQARILASMTDAELKQLRDQEPAAARDSFVSWWSEHHLFDQPAPDEPSTAATNGDQT